LAVDAYESAVATLDVDQRQRDALLKQDPTALVALLQARSTMFFGVFAPEEAPEDEPFEDQPDEPIDPDQV
jgi:hypothetical protein